MNKPTVLITGALAGIGKATAFAFAQECFNIVISGRKPDVGESFAHDLRVLGAEVAFIRADVRQEEEVQSLIAQTVARFGSLDVAVNNAGMGGDPLPIFEETLDNYYLTFDTNVLGLFLCLKHELKVMIQQNSGCIINISSIAGERPLCNSSIYCASKHAVNGLTKVAAHEAAFANVRVNAVAPGPINTEMFERYAHTEEQKASIVDTIPFKRVGTPDEVAQVIVFLASNKASFITGKIIGVDGGL